MGDDVQRTANPVHEKGVIYHKQRRMAATTLEESTSTFVVRTIVLLLVQFTVAIVFGLVFTELGKGATIFKFLAKYHYLYSIAEIATLMLMFLLYMFDFRFWAPGAVSVFVYVLLACFIFLVSILAFKTKPYAPLAILYIATPLVYVFFFDFESPGILFSLSYEAC